MTRHLYLGGLSAGLTTLATYAVDLLTPYAPSHALARLLGLPNAYVLAALLGGLLAFWLARGGKERITGFGGWQIGVTAGWLVFHYGVAYVWIIEAVLGSAFGPAAAVYTSLITLAILFVAMRLAAGWGERGLSLLLEWGERWEARRIAARVAEQLEAEGA